MSKITQWIKEHSKNNSGIYDIITGVVIPFDITQFIYYLMYDPLIKCSRIYIDSYTVWFESYSHFCVSVYDNGNPPLRCEINPDVMIKKSDIKSCLETHVIGDINLYQFLSTKICDDNEENDNNIAENNIQLIKQYINKLSQPNILIKGYELTEHELDNLLACELDEIYYITCELKFESIDYQYCLSNLGDYLTTRKKYLDNIRDVFNTTLFSHTYVVIIENLQWDFQVFESDSNIIIDVSIKAALVPNKEYYCSIGYYLTQLDNIARVGKDADQKLKVLAQEIRYEEANVTADLLRKYILRLKWNDIESQI